MGPVTGPETVANVLPMCCQCCQKTAYFAPTTSRFVQARSNKSPIKTHISKFWLMAEACGSRTQTFNSQLTANDDVAASARFQLESERFTSPQDFASLLSFGPRFSDCGIVDLCRRLAAQVSQLSDLGSIPIARSIKPVDAVAFTGFHSLNWPTTAG